MPTPPAKPSSPRCAHGSRRCRPPTLRGDALPEQIVKDIRRATRKHHSAEEKIRIVLEGLRGEYSIAELCRREGIAESLSWSGRWESNPRHAAWEAAVLPLNYARDGFEISGAGHWRQGGTGPLTPHHHMLPAARPGHSSS